MSLWMPGADRIGSGKGGTLIKGPPRCTWHITYDRVVPRRPSFDAVMKYLSTVRYEPHLGWDPLTGKTVQFIPANQSARALENRKGGVETNRLGDVHIQIEAFFTPGMVVNGVKYDQLTDTPMVGLPEILAWLDSLGIPRLWANAKKDRDLRAWLNVAGHRAHYNVPENSHTDIVGADTRALLMLDKKDLPATTPVTSTGELIVNKTDADAFRAIVQDELQTVLGQRTKDKKDTDPAHISLSDVYTQQEAADARQKAFETSVVERLDALESAIANIPSVPTKDL